MGVDVKKLGGSLTNNLNISIICLLDSLEVTSLLVFCARAFSNGPSLAAD